MMGDGARWTALGLGLVVAPLGCVDQAGDGGDMAEGAEHGDDSDPAVAALEARLEAHRSEAGAPGMAAALIVGDEVVWQGGFGTTRVDADAPVTAQTPFRLASVSKTVLGVGIMRAQELDMLALDDEVTSPIAAANPHRSDELPTWRRLAGHRSGIIDGPRYECAYHLEDGTWFDAAQAQLCGAAPVTGLGEFLQAYLRPDGSLYDDEHYDVAGASAGYTYSNVGAALAGLALGDLATRTGGEDLEAFTRAEIFEPLGMTHTAWHRAELPDPEGIAWPHHTVDGVREPLPPYALATYPDGGLHASVADLARFLAAVVGGRGQLGDARVLEAASVDTMLDFQPVDDVIVTGQGVFWERYLGLTGHTGGDPGVSTAMGYDEDRGVGFVVLVNESTPTTEALMLRVLDELETFAAG